MPYQILIVDDEPDLEQLVKQKFRKQVKQDVFEFFTAYNGLEALDVINRNGTIDLVLTDINMPQMDGLALLKEIKGIDNSVLKTVIVSAYGDMENIRMAMNLGAFDFITKPINFKDLEITIEKTLQEIENMKNAQKIHDQFVALQGELNIARTIQLSILPKIGMHFHDNQPFDLDARMMAAKEVGGDFYDYFMIDENRLGIVIGDVSGKGVPASIFMAVCKTAIKSIASHEKTTNNCFFKVNNTLIEECINDLYVTAFYAVIDMSTGHMWYSNAGHNATYVLNSAGSVKALPEVEGIPLGFRKNFAYGQGQLHLEKEDVLFMHTDGINEAMDEKESEFSESRIISALNNFSGKSCGELNQFVLEKVSEFCGMTPQGDDMTLLALKYV